jgi:hypothetical protein
MKDDLMNMYSFMACLIFFTFALRSFGAEIDSRADELNDSAPSEVEALAEKVANPISPITTFLFNSRINFFNHDQNQNSNYAFRAQPSVFSPFNDKSALLTRIVLPFTVNNYRSGDSGIGDLNILPYYLADYRNKTIFGAGLSLNVPIANERSLGSGKWATGPSLLIATTGKKIVHGLLLSHLQSIGGDPSRMEVESTTLQPFITFLLNKGKTISINSETNYSWNLPTEERFIFPVSLGVTQLILVQKKPLNFGMAGTYFVEGNSSTPQADFRFNMTYVFR